MTFVNKYTAKRAAYTQIVILSSAVKTKITKEILIIKNKIYALKKKDIRFLCIPKCFVLSRFFSAAFSSILIDFKDSKSPLVFLFKETPNSIQKWCVGAGCGL